MERERFPFGAAVRFGWRKTRENFWSLIVVTLIWIVLSYIFNYSGDNFEKTAPFAYFVIKICSTLASMVMTLGVTRIGLKIYAGEKFRVSEMFYSRGYFLKYLFASTLYFLAIAAGLVLLIVPGIIIIIRMGLYTYLIVDKKMGAIASLKESMRLTRGNAFNLLLFWFLLLGVLILGFLALVVGLIPAIPVTVLAYVFAYRYLEARKQPVKA